MRVGASARGTRVAAFSMEPRAPSPIRNGRVADWRLADADFVASFSLPGQADKCDRLRELNPLGRDKRIAFEESRHEYFVDGVKVPRSVTALVHTYPGCSLKRVLCYNRCEAW